MMKTVLAGVVVAAALAAPVDATTTLNQCAVTGTMTFSPKLTLADTSGQITHTYTATCLVERTNGASGVQTFTWTNVYSYQGSCVSAAVALGSSTVSVLVAGTVMVRADSNPSETWVAAFVLVPSTFNPCDMASALVIQGSAACNPARCPACQPRPSRRATPHAERGRDE